MTYKRNNNNNDRSNNILSYDNNPSPIKKTRNSNDDNNDEEYTEPKDLDDTPTTPTTTTSTSTSINNFLNFSNTSFNSSFNDSNNISQDDYNDEYSDTDEEAGEELNLSLTSDDILLSQIEILKSEWDFEVYNKCVPVVLQSIFHLSNKDKTERSLEQLKKKGLIRIFQIATSLNDYCIVITKDYIKCIDDLKSTSTKPTTSPTKTTSSTTSPIKSAPINTILLNRSEILELFKLKLVPYYNQVSISKHKLQQLLQVNDNSIGTTHQIDNIITVLVQCGLLLQKQEDNLYLFCVPGTGTFFSNLIRGRREVISSIQRLKYKEILKKDLLKKKLVYSNVKMDLLYKDLLGSGKIKVIPTTQGDLIRCIEFNEL